MITETQTQSTTTGGRLYNFIMQQAAWKNWKVLGIVLVILYFPALFAGRVLDDHLFHLAFSGDDRHFGESTLKLWGLTSKSATTGLTGQEMGVIMPWWTSTDFKLLFFRPLSALTFWIDFKLYPNQVWLHHLHSLLWFALFLFGLSAFYKTVFPRKEGEEGIAITDKIAFLAWAMFAINDANGSINTWLSQRNTMVALAIAIRSMIAHERYMQGKGSAWPGPLLFALSLTGGETAVSVLGYIALRTMKQPLRFLPYALITLVYVVFYKMAGFGTSGTGFYIEPFNDPLRYLVAVINRWPVLANSLFSPVSATTWLYLEPAPQFRYVLTGLGYVSVAVFIWALRPFRSFTHTWLIGGSFLSLLPVCAMFPHDRLLAAGSIGAFVVIAHYLVEKGRGFFWWFFIVTHFFMAALMVPVQVGLFSVVGKNASDKISKLERSIPKKTETIVLINAPGAMLGFEFHSTYTFYAGKKSSDYFRMLANNQKPARLKRIDEHTIEMEADFVNTEMEMLYRNIENRVPANFEVRHPGFTAKVLEIGPNKTPQRVRFTFKDRLEDLTIVTWWSDDFRIIQPPPVGGVLEIPEAAPYLYF